MNLYTHCPRFHRVVFVMVFAGLLTTFASINFVTADNDRSSLAPTSSTTNDSAVRTKIAERFGRLPLSFEINEGQVDPAVKFLSRGPGYDLFLTANEAVLKLRRPRELKSYKQGSDEVREGSVLRLKMIGANNGAHVEGRDELPGKINYFTGNDPEKWRRNISTFQKVYYKDVYPGIDIVYYGNQQELEYDFVVAPGANPKVIKFQIDGADRITLDKSGSLLLALTHGEVRLNKPFIYQLSENGARNEIKGEYAINGKQISFKLRGFDSGKPLVIDPVLSYSTFLGSAGSESAQGIAVDSQGAAYVTGFTDSSTFPTTAGSFKSSNNSGGAYVTKLNSTGTGLVYSTYLAGNNSSSTSGTKIAVDATGNAHVTGITTATDFPLVNPLKTSGNFFKTSDSAANWNNLNTGLRFDVHVIAVAPNALQKVYVATPDGPYSSNDSGATWTRLSSTGFPHAAASSMAVSPVNSAVVWAGFQSGFLFKSGDGGASWSPVSLPVAGLNHLTIVFDPVTPSTMYVGTTGGVFKSVDSGTTWTAANNFSGLTSPPSVRTLAIDPTTPATIYAGTLGRGIYKTTNGGGNWSPINNGLTGSNNEFVNTIAIDPLNTATVYSGHGFSGGPGIVHKTTNGGGLWTPMSSGLPNAGVIALVADRSAAATLYAATNGGGIFKTINGGTNWTSANAGVWNANVLALVAHPSNSAIMYAGATGSVLHDAFVTKLNSSGSGLLFSTYLGGSANDSGSGIAVDTAGNIYVAGDTNSRNFPTINAIKPAQTPTECNDGFVTKINPAIPAYAFSTYLGGTGCESATALALDSAGDVYITGNTTSTNFPTANAFQPNIGGSFDGDAFVTKLATNGSLAYSTYLGGTQGDFGRAITVNSSGQAFVTGDTQSSNFPTLNPIHGFNTSNDEEAFVTKLSSQGSTLVYSTYLGGDMSDSARGIAVDAAGNAHVVGITDSGNFPVVPGALRTKSTLFKSLDNGRNWSNDNYGINNGINFSLNSLLIHPTQTSTLYAGTQFGVFKSTNGGRTWSASNNGLNETRVIALVMDPLTPSTLYAATRVFDSNVFGIYKSTDGGATWNLRKNGMTTTAAIISLVIDPVSPNILYAALNSNSGSSGGQLFKTTDGADNWTQTGNVPPVSFSSMAVDPHTHTTVYGAALNVGLFRSVDSGANWNPIGLSQTGAFARLVATSPHTSGLLFAQFSQGTFKSVDGGNNWSLVTSEGGPIVFDPVSASTIYLLTPVKGIFKSVDSGATWVQLIRNFQGTSTTVLAIDPLKTSTMYFATLPAGGDTSYVAKLNPAGNGLIYSTFLPGTVGTGDFFGINAHVQAIALDNSGNAYISGLAQSPGLATTPNSFQPLLRAQADAFISKLTMSHIISGHVRDGSSAPVSGAEVVLNDGTSIIQVLTEGDGSYEFSRLREGGTYTVTAFKAHFTMAPPSQTVNNLTSNQTLNFTATATASAFHTISGQITNNATPLAGVTVTLSGSQSALRTTDSNGNYSFELPAGGNYTLTPSILGFTFGPLNQTFNNLSAPQTANFAATRQNFVVTNTNNHGPGSLRDAIVNANATVGTDTITFNIPGSGVKTINLVNQLPDIIDPVVIDGTTQPGYAGLPLVEINGLSISGQRGLAIRAGGTTVRGLAIVNFSSGFAIAVSDCDNNVFQANHIGIDAAGTTERQNGTGISLSNSSNNLIGGTTAAARNVISGNTSSGIQINGSNNVVQGNYIGTNAAGTDSLGFSGRGIEIGGIFVGNNLIGGTTSGAGNLISGPSRGILIFGPGTTIQGNLIGTDVTGTKRVTNSGTGIETFQATNTVVGGLTPGARNIISGNAGMGVFISGAGSKVQGNFIGTDITGTQPLGNSGTGLLAANATLVGGTTPEARNVIAANGGNVVLGENNSGVGVTLQGNYIGTDVTGTKALSSNTVNGVAVVTSGHVIGGSAPGAQNVISGNMNGITVGGFSSGVVTGIVIKGNIIGLNAQGTAPVPNTQFGVQFSNAQNNTLGGLENGAANKIAFSGAPGVFVFGGSGNSIRGNSIFSNGGLGIDLHTINDSPIGVTPNDPNDADLGSNNLQNFPVITTVSSNASSTTILGNLNSTPNTTFQIDFYSNAAVDPSGNGEGGLFFGTTSVTTNAGGNAAIDVTFPIALPTGRVITATATDPNGNTSEFSAADPTGAAGSVQLSLTSFFVIEDVGMANVTVQRVGGSSGALSVQYETTNGTAIAGEDYTAVSGTLNFANGETSKTVQVPILNDETTEPDETFTFALKNASSLDAFGSPASMVITIQDRTTVPVLLVLNTSVIEGNAGTATEARFEVILSAATGRTVTVSYTTNNGNAHGGAACGTQGVDFESTTGSFVFEPGTFQKFIPVKVCGDNSAELNEGFFFSLVTANNATIGHGDGLGTILNDDVIELVLEESSPIVNQAAAVDSIFYVRDPFRIVSVPELFATAAGDRNTRMILFVRNLELNPGETSAAVIVRLIASNNLPFEVFAEDFRAVPNTDLMQVVFRIPTNFPAGTATIFIRAHGRISNLGTIRIAP